MKKTIIIRLFRMAAALALTFMIWSCEEKVAEQPALRLFMPIMNSTTITGNNLTFSWIGIKGSVAYSLELSRDSFQLIDKAVTVSSDTTEYTFSDLVWEEKYYLRLIAINEDPTLDSKPVITTASTPKFPTLLVTPQEGDISDISIVLRWNNIGDPVTSISLALQDGTVIKEVPITADDIAAQMKEITGVNPSTSYTLSIYSGAVFRGSANYITLPPPSFGPITIDLRQITGRPYVLTDTMLVTGSGATYILRRGESYICNDSSGALLVNKSFTVMCLPGTGSQALLTFNNENQFSGDVDSVKFEDVRIKAGYRVSDGSLVNYFMNTTSSNTCNIGLVSFVNCHISGFGNAIIRLQSGADPYGVIQNLYVDNCIFDSIGIANNYAIFQAANGGANGNRFENIEVRNSSFYNFAKGFIINSMADNNSILVENCTFNYMITAANYYFIDLSSYNSASFTLKNCILGQVRIAGGVGGIRVGATTTVNVLNTYNTSDFVTLTSPIGSIIPYAGASTDLWIDPANGDFHFKATDFPGSSNAGDPRWR